MKWIKHSKISGSVSAPASKSMSLRATAAALLSKGESQILNPSYCDDAHASLHLAEDFDAHIEREPQFIKIKGGGSLQKTELNCNESGLCMRMFTPIAALYNKKITLVGTGSLMTRPMGMVEEPLNQLGASCRTKNGFPPIVVKGPIKGGKIMIDGSISSQFLTGLLIALPMCKADSELTVTHLKSKAYVAMTLSLLTQFGISICSEKNFKRFFIKGSQNFRETKFSVEGDWSGAAFLLVAGAVNGEVLVTNLQMDSLQPDKSIVDVLELAGAKISIMNDSVSVKLHRLKAFEFDAADCPDLFPPLVVLACHCVGKSLIWGDERLKYKESDRAEVLFTEFTKIGAKINISGNRIEIEGSPVVGGHIDSHNDHRIAMAGAIAGLNAKKGVFVRGWHCVSKSYPGFFEDLISIGGDTL